MLDNGVKFYARIVKVALLAVSLAFIYGLTKFYLFGGSFLFMRQTPVQLNEVDILAGDTATSEKLMGWLRIKQGKDLFPSTSFRENDLRGAYNLVMVNANTLASMSVSREFTGKVVIRATERIPLARIEGSNLAVDREGHVFTCMKSGFEGLVSIDGAYARSLVSEGGKGQGRVVDSAMGMAAIRLIDYLSEGTAVIKIAHVSSVRIDNTDYLKIIFKDSRTARLAWDCMKSPMAEDGRPFLMEQLDNLAKAMSSPEGRNHRNFDFTIKERGYGLWP